MKRSQKTSLLFIETAGGQRPLTDLEKCLLLILKTENNISSQRVLKLAKRFKICAACSDRSEVFSTGEKLLKKNLIKRKLKGNEYFWALTKKGLIYSQQI
jgi:hypothetical protein